jgi:hypothetical protein
VINKVRELQKRWSTDQLITGIELPGWLEMLARNDFKVDREYFHRAAWITGWSLGTTALGRLEDSLYGRQLSAMEVDPEPLFLLGHWRSGTTHLHNLLGRDPNNTFSTVYQVVFPTCFLVTEKYLPKLTSGMLSETRTYDNVKQGWYESAEDEIALAKLTGLSPYISFMFPENAAKYEKYVDFMEVRDDERKKWKEAFIYFIKKIMIATNNKRVVVKSCTHSARIRLILEMFPNARFVHIHRNPYEVFSSTLHMRSHTDWENFFQIPEENYEQQRLEQTAIMGQRIYERLIEDRKLIPEGNFIELRYEDFAGNELPYLKQIYEQFNLPGWEKYEATISPYLDSLKGYKRNKLKIDDQLKEFVYDRWRLVFDTFGYDKEYGS